MRTSLLSQTARPGKTAKVWDSMWPEIKERIADKVNKTATVYSLSYPDSGIVFYVGCTCDPIEKRLRNHQSPTAVALRRSGAQAVIEPLEITTAGEAGRCETYWISQFKSWGFPLENKAEMSGFRLYDPELIAKLYDAGSEEQRIAVALHEIMPIVSVYSQSLFVIQQRTSYNTIGRYLNGHIRDVRFAKLMLWFFRREAIREHRYSYNTAA